MTFPVLIVALGALSLLVCPSAAFSLRESSSDGAKAFSRRALLGGLVTAPFVVPSIATAQDEVEWTPFNGLIFNYRNSDKNTGLDASTLNEPSVPFTEFSERLKKGEVLSVEFLAPNGDAAYATFKDKPDSPIRIGEGYPIEQNDGWSSPAFVVRAVQNQGVPYKFSVPALAAYKN